MENKKVFGTLSVNVVPLAFMQELCYVVTWSQLHMIAVVPWLGQFPVFHCGGPGLIPGHSVKDLWWINWKWSRCFSKYFSFDLSVLFHQCSSFIHLPQLLSNLTVGSIIR